jgi:hypothetical protein
VILACRASCSRASHTPFTRVVCLAARHSGACRGVILRASFTSVARAVRMCRRALFTRCRATRMLSRACSRVIRALFACRRHSFARSCRASGSRVARISRVDHVCRAASTRDNKLFLLINTHVNNINLLDHIF